MFTYKIVKHDDTENGTLYALYETADDQAEADEVVVMGQAPVNGVFYESLDELVEHITDLYTYVKQVESGEQAVVSADDVTFVEMEGEDCCGDGCDCGEDCDCGDDCGCGHGQEGEWRSFDENEEDPSTHASEQAQARSGGHPNMKNGQCCGGNCGCK